MELDTLKDFQKVQRNLRFYTSAEFQDFRVSVLESRAVELRRQADMEAAAATDPSAQASVFIKIRLALEIENIVKFVIANLEQEGDLYRRDFDSSPLAMKGEL